MRRTRILTAVLALAAGLLAGTPPALAATDASQQVAKEVSSAADTYTWKNARIDGGGFVPGIVFNRKEKNLAYARTDIGGAYRWQESTKTWAPLLDSVGWDDWGHTGVVSLASDSVDPDKVYAAVGTYQRLGPEERRGDALVRPGRELAEDRAAVQAGRQHAGPWHG